ncbi:MULTISPECIES: type IV pilin N-terminal domain-containing protein [unclassified Methanoculleus]|jgi:FlaG/FlaF family flagellin (archaellin)|uniref:type IV pilin N-terminal domain-containing protein n=1 Tax=unclassified Methanoculleus TaxID=2619537 RepID=UPI0025FD418D|nr:type IV pilin N-terminal domain-containing protein [Methanoculleus sp. UBA377]
MKRKYPNSRGISEVFGVMLMLTITLIVACIVAVFVGGFSFGDEEQAISANLVASELNTSADPPYILFEHVSGDPVDLNSIVISLGLRSSAKNTTNIQNTEDSDYIQNYGAPDKTKIAVGDRFILYADGSDDDGIYWEKSPTARFFAPWNDYITYQILDVRSNRPISSGKIPVDQPR